MDPNKIFSNPMLCGTIELMKAENTPEHRKMFIDEMIRGRYLSPVVITPTPTPDAQGRFKITAEHKVQFPMLSTKDDQKFFMAFTDYDEFKKWNPAENQQTFAMTFYNYAEMLLRKDKDGNLPPALGFVINPLSSNVMVSRELVSQIVASRVMKQGMPIPPTAQAAPQEGNDEAEQSAE